MPLDDVVLEATLAAIPAGLLAHLIAGAQTARARQSGKAGARQKEASRGRKIGTRRAALRAASRIDLIATLKAAAPWQMVRRRPDDAASQMVRVTHDDLRVARHRHRAGTTTIFVVDASGSSALQRLSEAKGAVRLMLAECYVRRDEVALIAFRGQGAETLLAPTRALTHAQRALAALPGGGGTPIAAGLVAAQQLAAQVAREGRTPMIVVMTDGKANVALDGAHGRPQAQDDARAAARRLATAGFATLLIDTSPQPQQLAADLAAAMQARYLAMPRADARRMAAAISAASALERSAA
jgi:magnesium chelatase subunit D